MLEVNKFYNDSDLRENEVYKKAHAEALAILKQKNIYVTPVAILRTMCNLLCKEVSKFQEDTV